MRPFDLSRRDVFSVKSGVLNVNFIQHTIPESKYEVSHAQITRVDPVQTAPFARMSENYEYYFVPYSQLFQDFERIYYERGDVQRNPFNSSLEDSENSAMSIPVFSWVAVVSSLAFYFASSRLFKVYRQNYPTFFERIWKERFVDGFSFDEDSPYILDVHGELCQDEMIKLFDMLGYGNLYPVFQNFISILTSFDVPNWEEYLRLTDGWNPDTDEVLLSVYQKNLYNKNLFLTLCSHFNCKYESAQNLDPNLNSFEIDFTDLEGDTFNKSLVQFFFAYLQSRSGQGITGYLPGWTFPGQQSAYSSLRAFYDILTNPQTDFTNYLYSYRDYKVSYFPIAAYVKVFADIYRNQQFDNKNYSSLFNCDYLATTDTPEVGWFTVINALVPRFRQYKKDVFTGVFPNAQFGSVAVSSLNNPATITAAKLPPQNNLDVTVDAADGKLRTVASATTYNKNFNIDSGVSALAIRQALSLQRYKERILRAGNRLSSLQNAVFGDRSRFIENNYVQFIGAEHNSIDFNSVAATSDAGSSNVGELAANGVGTHVGRSFEFHSHDFGIILGIYYVLPESEYESFMIDPMNHKSETNDFYKPDFMNLGLSPVFNFDFNFLTGSSVHNVIGYLANYWEYKTSIDKVHGNFYNSVPFDIGYFTYGLPIGKAYERGSNAHYVTPRSGQAFSNQLTLSVLYVNPHDIDSIFYQNSDDTIETDQFKVNCNHDVKALLPMSVVGLPEY